MMNPKQYPNRDQEIAALMGLGFMIDNWLVNRTMEVSSDPQICANIYEGLEKISKFTLTRVNHLMHDREH